MDGTITFFYFAIGELGDHSVGMRSLYRQETQIGPMMASVQSTQSTSYLIS